MKKESLKKVLSVGVAAAMMMGNALPVMAATGDGVTGGGDGQGTSTGHLDTTYVEASVPTDGTITSLFSFYVDPEDIIGAGGKFAEADVEKVADLVYFAAEEDGKYASTSQELVLTIKSYKNVDVSVTATVDADTTGLIPLAETDTDISSTTPANDAALYLTLNVGEEDPVAITTSGASSVATLDGQSDNFEITGTVGSFVATPKSTVQDEDWDTIAISLSGKAQLVKDATGIVAPKVTLAYEIALHPDTVATGVAYTTKAANGDVTITFTPGTDAKTLATNSFKINGVETSAWSSYSTNIIFNNDNTITVKAAVFGFSSITGATTDDKYTFTVKDTDGNSYSTAEVTIQ